MIPWNISKACLDNNFLWKTCPLGDCPPLIQLHHDCIQRARECNGEHNRERNCIKCARERNRVFSALESVIAFSVPESVLESVQHARERDWFLRGRERARASVYMRDI